MKFHHLQRTHPAPVATSLSALLGDLKKNVGSRLARQFRLPAALIRRAVNEAEHLARDTGFPHLFLPELAAEQVRRIFGVLADDQRVPALSRGLNPVSFMKTHLATLILAALLALAPANHAAERSSSDETAIRMGVEAWLNAWSTNTERPDSGFVPTLYVPAIRESKTVPPKPAVLAEFEQWTAKRAGDLKLTIRGDVATTAFTFAPEGVDKSGQPLKAQSQVLLVWERRSGLWQISRQQTIVVTGIALSASGR